MVSIVNYRMGNLRSVQNALTYLRIDSEIIDSPRGILNSNKLILPGVGSFRAAMEHINNIGLLDALNIAVLERKVPVLGICLGMQLLSREGEEDGLTQGLGWIPAAVRRFPQKTLSIKVPHIGFDTVYFEPRGERLFNGLNDSADFYFVHSYRMICDEPAAYVSGWAYNGERFVASIERENIFGTQFHPEKSQSNGLTVLKNFCELVR